MKIILLLTVFVVSSNAWAGLVCGQIEFTGECAPGFECLQIQDVLYTFNKNETQQKALDSLFFAVQKAEILGSTGSTCLILDEEGVLESAETLPMYRAQIHSDSKIKKG